MGRPDFGLKMICVSCAARFYDLHRAPGTCPKCGTVQPPARPRVPATPRSTARRWLPRQAAPAVAEVVVADAIDVSEGLEDVDPPEVDDDDDETEIPEVAEEG